MPFWVSEDDQDELAGVEFANVERIIDKVGLPADPVSQIIRHLLAHLAEIKLGADEKHVIGALDFVLHPARPGNFLFVNAPILVDENCQAVPHQGRRQP